MFNSLKLSGPEDGFISGLAIKQDKQKMARKIISSTTCRQKSTLIMTSLGYPHP